MHLDTFILCVSQIQHQNYTHFDLLGHEVMVSRVTGQKRENTDSQM